MEAVDHIREKRITDSTKSNYKCKINIMKSFFIQNPQYSNCVVDGNIVLPLEDQAIKSFFSWLSVNTNLPKKKNRARIEEADQDPLENQENEEDDPFAINKVTISAACMQAYKSALMWFHRQHAMAMSPQLISYLDEFLQGYKKTVAEKKSKGVMNIVEGKSPLSFQGIDSFIIIFIFV